MKRHAIAALFHVALALVALALVPLASVSAGDTPWGDYQAAIAHYSARAAENDKWAIHALQPFSGPRTEAEKIDGYRRAAAQGNPVAQVLLGLLHAAGRGKIPRDDVLALMWFRLAAATGDKWALEYNARLSKSLMPAEIAKAERMAETCRQSKFSACD